jgi:hypothetical protein
MADTSTSTRSGGIGFTGLLTIVFVVLKLLGKITWSWWWVISPIWIPVGLVLVLVAFIGIAAVIVAVIEKGMK